MSQSDNFKESASKVSRYNKANQIEEQNKEEKNSLNNTLDAVKKTVNETKL